MSENPAPAPVRTTCPYCGVGCGIRATVTGERSVAIAGDPEHPANFGRLCSKGAHLGETVGLEGRLLHPMIGSARASWDEALDLVAARMRDCIEQHGPDSVAFYVSGQLLTEDYYVANKLLKGFVGTANIDTNSRLCMASAVAAHNRAFGEDVVPCTYDDLDEAELILIVGSNTAWCHPVIWQRIEQARERSGTRIVVIDPRRTETAEQADLHVGIAPDGDIALFNALLAEMARRGLAEGQGVAACDPGIPADLFATLADLVAAHPRMVTLFSQGANQSVCGTDKGNAIINLHLATGRINAPGAGPFSITGQPNAMGGREVGGLANTLACHLGFSQAERDSVAAFWKTHRLCAAPGLKAVDLFRAVNDGQIKFIWVMATNPAVSMPDAGFVRAALAKCPTVVVSDVIADTDTARLAHVRLPALAWGEKDGTVTNSERRISRQRPLFAPPGEARADWAILADVGRRLGHGDAFAFASAAAVFREYAAMTALAVGRGKLLDLTDKAGVTDAGYEAMTPFAWGGRHPLARSALHTVPVAVPASVADPAWPLRLNTGRYRDQWHTMTRTGLSPTLSQHRREPLLEIHPDDAVDAGIAGGGLARVSSPHGASLFRVHVTTAQARGTVFVPMHWTDALAGEGRCNRLPGQEVDPFSGQPGFKNVGVRVEGWVPEWQAFRVARDALRPEAAWWTASRIPGGWLHELAGSGPIDPDALLPAGVRAEAADVARGMRRIAVIAAEGTLDAVLYLTRSGRLPDRDWVIAQLGAPVANAAELLAGRPAEAAPDRGPIVCVCHGVRSADVVAAAHGGALTVAAIGAETCAGTNCGSCRPAIARLLADIRSETMEAAR